MSGLFSVDEFGIVRITALISTASGNGNFI
jgi:hypothetical protein